MNDNKDIDQNLLDILVCPVSKGVNITKKHQKPQGQTMHFNRGWHSYYVNR